jgi:SCF-associated factor 1
MLDCTSPETTPVQAESGWSFSSILTQSGDVLVFWPSEGEIGRLSEVENAAMDERGDCNAYGTEDRLIPCVTWSLRADPLRIPRIPQLPELESTGVSQEDKSKTTTLIKIAAFDNHLIGLTNKGHVLKFGDLSSENRFDGTTRWQYVRSPCICVAQADIWYSWRISANFPRLQRIPLSETRAPVFRPRNLCGSRM